MDNEQTLGDSEGQGSLACCSSWGCKESDTTEWLNSKKGEVNQKEINTISYHLYMKNPTISDKAHLVLSFMSPASSHTTVRYHLLPATLSAVHCLVWTMFLLIAESALAHPSNLGSIGDFLRKVFHGLFDKDNPSFLGSHGTLVNCWSCNMEDVITFILFKYLSYLVNVGLPNKMLWSLWLRLDQVFLSSAWNTKYDICQIMK